MHESCHKAEKKTSEVRRGQVKEQGRMRKWSMISVKIQKFWEMPQEYSNRQEIDQEGKMDMRWMEDGDNQEIIADRGLEDVGYEEEIEDKELGEGKNQGVTGIDLEDEGR